MYNIFLSVLADFDQLLSWKTFRQSDNTADIPAVAGGAGGGYT